MNKILTDVALRCGIGCGFVSVESFISIENDTEMELWAQKFVNVSL